MKKLYTFRVPIVGEVCITVEAENQKEAEEAALQVDWDADIVFDDPDNWCESINLQSCLFQGNVSYVSLHKMELTDVEEVWESGESFDEDDIPEDELWDGSDLDELKD